MSFFSQFPTISYDTNKDGVLDEVTDIFRYVDVKDSKIDDLVTYTYYEIEEGDRPDIVSQKLYGTPDYYWTFFIINDSLKHGMEDWPKSNQELEDFLQENFGKLSIKKMNIKVEDKTNGGQVDNVEFVPNVTGNGTESSSYSIST